MGNKRRLANPKAFSSADKQAVKKNSRLQNQKPYQKRQKVDAQDAFSDTEQVSSDIEEESAKEITRDDDEEIDEDLAFDNDDEDKFGSFFAGIIQRKKKATSDINLLENEDQRSEELSDFENDPDAIDISQLFDDSKPKTAQVKRFFEHSESDNDQEDNEEDVPQDLSSITLAVPSENKKQKKSVKFEAYDEGEFNLGSGDNAQLSLDMLLNAIDDPGFNGLKRQAKSIEKSASKTSASAPLAPLLQDRINREAAYKESNRDVSQWMPIVQKNRQAEHLEFASQSKAPHLTTIRHLSSTMKPSNTMESQIADVLIAAGVASEKDIIEAETLALNKVDPEMIKAQQVELQKMRSLLFYAEIKQKRAAKIKSRKYRKIRKKEMQKLKESETGNVEIDDEKRMEAERLRAEERMTLRHSNQKKKSFQFNDEGEEGRDAVMEKMQRHEQLMKKISGESSDTDSVNSDVDEDVELREILTDLKNKEQEKNPKGVFAMKFMQKALDSKKAAAIEDLEKMLAESGDESSMNESPSNPGINEGRLSFGLSSTKKSVNPKKSSNTFALKEETHVDLNDEFFNRESEDEVNAGEIVSGGSENPWLKQENLPNRKQTKVFAKHVDSKSDHARAQKLEVKVQKKSSSFEGGEEKIIILGGSEANQNLEMEQQVRKARDSKNKISFSEQKELIELAFEDDDVIREFEREKGDLVNEDAPQTIDITLPGWGTWSNQKRKNPIVKQKPGIDPETRKDYKLKHVIINEKKDKKFVEKYQISKLPFPHKSKATYDALLRAPVGKEWNTEESHQKLVRPRIITRTGAPIAPPNFVKQPKDKAVAAAIPKKLTK